MKIAVPALIAGLVALPGGDSAAMAQMAGGHEVVAPNEIECGPGPTVLPPGAKAAVLFGDPAKPGLFALRIKLPEGYNIPPHTHPVDEVVTVISGTFRLGMGETADRATAQPLPGGSFFALLPGTAHYAFTDEETVIQINTVGPWGLTYINAKDDPRQKSQ